MDGIQNNHIKQENKEKEVKALHVEAHRLSDILTKDISSILKGKAVNKYTMAGDIGLVPQYAHDKM